VRSSVYLCGRWLERLRLPAVQLGGGDQRGTVEQEIDLYT
jgi:hypothetical protein